MNNPITSPQIMFAPIEVTNEVSCSLAELPPELKRVLRVQWREFIHYIEDAQDGLGVSDRLIRVTAA